MNIVNFSPDEWIENEFQYKDQVLQDSVWENIPLLNANNLDQLSDLKLVRFRGMVQDMHGPEYYLEKYRIVNTITNESKTKFSKYVDLIDCKENEIIDYEGSGSIKNERQSYVVISIPGLNEWVTNHEEEKYKIHKISDLAGSSSAVKRSSEDIPTNMDVSSNDHSNKKQCLQKADSAPIAVSCDSLLNFPIPNEKGKACHVKIYDSESTLSLNTVAEFVGFLSVSPFLVNEEMEDENMANKPSPALIPRIHCVAFKKLSHCNPLVNEQNVMSPEKMQFIKKELMIIMTQLFLGDSLAAELFIYNLISEVYLRKDCMAIGKFTLNISNVPKFENADYVEEFYNILNKLVPKSHYLPMSLETMNESAFIPKKDYVSNRLSSSILQLSSNTHVVLDETKLSAGKLNEAGVKGVQAIANAIKNQKLLYDFTYYQMEYDCNIPFLIFSEGKSLLPSDFYVALQPDELHLATFQEILEAARHFLKPELLHDIRVYLTTAMKSNYELSDGVLDMVQNEFVRMRQTQGAGGEDLHRLLVLARVICISVGKNCLDEDSWKAACALEQMYKERQK